MNSFLTSLFGNVLTLICFIITFILLLFFIRYKNRSWIAWVGIVLSFIVSLIVGSSFLSELLSGTLKESIFNLNYGFIPNLLGFLVYLLEIFLSFGSFYLLNKPKSKNPKK